MQVPVAGSLTALVVHFGLYYGRITPYMEEGTRNPAIAATFAITSSLLVSFIVWAIMKARKPSSSDVKATLSVETPSTES